MIDTGMSHIGFRCMVAMLHLSFDKPARHMREYLSVLLPLLRDGKVSYSGETLGADAGVGIRPVGPLPVLLAALAPQMLQLAGAVGDGTVLWMTGRTIAEHVVPRLTDAAAERRTTAAAWCVCCRSASPTTRRRHTGGGRQGVLRLRHAAVIQGDAGQGELGPGDVAIVGDEGAVRQQVEALAEIGVTDFVAGEFATGEDAARARALLGDLATGGR